MKAAIGSILAEAPFITLCKEVTNLLAADFNAGPPNNVGGSWGPWNGFPNDPTQGCMTVAAPDVTGDPDKFSLGIIYDVDSPNQAFCGTWMTFGPEPAENNPIDVSDYKTLSFYLRGDNALGFTRNLKIELRDRFNSPLNPVYVTGITDEWKAFKIPLTAFRNGSELRALTEFVMVFEDLRATTKEGTVYLDQVVFKPNVSNLTIADFNTGTAPNNIGGSYGAWNQQPGMPSCQMIEVADDALGNPNGLSLRMEYDFEEPGSEFCGLFMKLGSDLVRTPRLDATDYKRLRFRLKGASSPGHNTEMKIELKLADGRSAQRIVQGITEEWKHFSIPLTRFFPAEDHDQLSELVVVFERQNSNPSVGAILLDHVKLTKN